GADRARSRDGIARRDGRGGPPCSRLDWHHHRSRPYPAGAEDLIPYPARLSKRSRRGKAASAVCSSSSVRSGVSAGLFFFVAGGRLMQRLIAERAASYVDTGRSRALG